LRRIVSRRYVLDMKDQRQPTPVERTERVFARRLRELREERGLSQARLSAELARAGLKLDDLAILRIEKAADGPEGARRTRLGEAAVIAKVLGVRLNDMIRDTVTPVEKFEAAALDMINSTTQLGSTKERLAAMTSQAIAAQRLYEQSVQLLDDEDLSDPRVGLLRSEVEKFRKHEELASRRSGLIEYIQYLTEREVEIADEIAQRDPETEVHTVQDRRDRLEYTRSRRAARTAELRIVEEELAELAASRPQAVEPTNGDS